MMWQIWRLPCWRPSSHAISLVVVPRSKPSDLSSSSDLHRRSSSSPAPSHGGLLNPSATSTLASTTQCATEERVEAALPLVLVALSRGRRWGKGWRDLAPSRRGKRGDSASSGLDLAARCRRYLGQGKASPGSARLTTLWLVQDGESAWVGESGERDGKKEKKFFIFVDPTWYYIALWNLWLTLSLGVLGPTWHTMSSKIWCRTTNALTNGIGYIFSHLELALAMTDAPAVVIW